MNSMKRQNDRILKVKLPRSVGAQYATRDQWRNNSRKNEGMEPKQKQYPAATHSSILAWRIPQTEEAGGLQSTGSQRVRYDSEAT